MNEAYRVISQEFGGQGEFDHADFATLEEAEAFARLVAQNDEMDAYIYRLLSAARPNTPTSTRARVTACGLASTFLPACAPGGGHDEGMPPLLPHGQPSQNRLHDPV